MPVTSLDSFYSSYVDTYIKRDVSDLTQVANLTDFYRFMRVAAAHTGQVLNVSALASDTSIAPNTAKQWLSILVSSGLVVLVEPFFANSLSRIRKSPKLHFMDLGLCAHLMGWPNAETLERSTSGGAFFESWVISELYKSYINAGKTPHFFYYRDQRKQEVDLLIQEGTTLYPLEIKKAASARRDDARPMATLREKLFRADSDAKDKVPYKVGTGCIIDLDNKVSLISKDDISVPAWLI